MGVLGATPEPPLPAPHPDLHPLRPSAGYSPGISPPWSTLGLASCPGPRGTWKHNRTPRRGRGGGWGGSRRGADPALALLGPLGRSRLHLPLFLLQVPGRPRPGLTRLREAAEAVLAPAPSIPGSRPRAGNPGRTFRAAKHSPAAGAGARQDQAERKTRPGIHRARNGAGVFGRFSHPRKGHFSRFI